MNKLYALIDRIWQVISETVFIRFEFDMPVVEIKKFSAEGRLIFTLTHGGLVEWLILSSWCRREGLGAILVINRLNLLLLSKPRYFFEILFRQKNYSELFLSQERGPRLLFCPVTERKRPFDNTKTEKVLCELYLGVAAEGRVEKTHFVPIFILWRKHVRGEQRTLSEFLFGLRSKPNYLGKIWYLLRRRMDSSVRALTPLSFNKSDPSEGDEVFGDTEAMRLAKSVRRRILVLHHQEMRVVLGPRYLSPQTVIESLMRDPQIQDVITAISGEQNLDRKKVMAMAYQDLVEIAANYRFRFIELMHLFLTWLFSKLFNGVDVRQEDLQNVRQVMKVKPIVFIPCHRSHLDYLLLPYILFSYDMVTPYVAAGINLAFWPVGKFLRMGGAFFIRRSFRGDPLYGVCLKKYVEYLLQHRYNISFFIEGTRSRSGKMLPPAYGLLKMVMEAYESNVCEDIALIPVSVSYDEVPEQGAYTKELSGGDKTKESATELLKSGSILRKNFGQVYLRFSEAISLKNIYQGALDRDKNLLLQKTAFHICKSINDATPVTTKAIVCSVLIGHDSSPLPLEKILDLSEKVFDKVEIAAFSVNISSRLVLKRSVEQILRGFQKSNILQVVDTVPRTYFCEPRKRILLNYYKNNAMHCLVLPSITLASLKMALSVTTPGNEFESAFTTAAFQLRNLLKFEFFFDPKPIFLKEIQKCLRGILKVNETEDLNRHLSLVEGVMKQPESKVLARLIGEYLESYWILSEFLETSDSNLEKKIFLQRVLKYAQTKELIFPESLSLQNYTNGLSLFENLKIIQTPKIVLLPTPIFQEVKNELKAFLQCLG